jgi:hypothetical protein
MPVIKKLIHSLCLPCVVIHSIYGSISLDIFKLRELLFLFQTVTYKTIFKYYIPLLALCMLYHKQKVPYRHGMSCPHVCHLSSVIRSSTNQTSKIRSIHANIISQLVYHLVAVSGIEPGTF